MNEGQSTKRIVKQRLFLPFPPMAKSKEKEATHDQDEDMATRDFDYSSEPELDIICNMIYVLPIEYDTIIEVIEEEDNGFVEELAKHKALCYYVMKDGYVDEDKVVFERFDMAMQQHLKPMFIVKLAKIYPNVSHARTYNRVTIKLY